ncbi:unnamed protein product [Adineta steineri]|uniref:C3H1-type domain-containing protein n=1 Tax=Adineta steineri TaxID=433720 RepID=A0A815KJN2_9BILA|nr:unnamed protein product [Adineta steineri]CAF1212142.1 unnamed protein product [Adineta steineri]CAF1245337.1 unnamed protein product [Adineta steineri]CAF1270255.1 unnamed protein product [Adineta steineri]CAF1396615.1 unnamed protein product [Adineta steineri]
MFQLPTCYLHDMLTSINVNVLSPTSSTKVYSKAVGGPVVRSNSQHMTTITTHIIQTTSPSSSSDSSSISSSGGGKTSSQRYKTESCRSYHETGFCKYGEKCQFAHGYHEIRSLNRHPKYKTVLCRTYHCTGYCPYGPRCHFVHDQCSDTLSCNTISPSSSSTFGSDIRSSVSSSRSISPMDSPITSSEDIFLSAFLLNK